MSCYGSIHCVNRGDKSFSSLTEFIMNHNMFVIKQLKKLTLKSNVMSKRTWLTIFRLCIHKENIKSLENSKIMELEIRSWAQKSMFIGMQYNILKKTIGLSDATDGFLFVLVPHGEQDLPTLLGHLRSLKRPLIVTIRLKLILLSWKWDWIYSE